MGSNPSEFKGEKLPVENVNFNDVKAFCDALKKEGTGSTIMNLYYQRKHNGNTHVEQEQ